MSKFKIILSMIASLLLVSLIVLFILLILYDRQAWSIVAVIICIVLIDAGFAFYIMNSSRRHLYTKACWLLCICFFPLLGCLFFVIFGTFPMNLRDWNKMRDEQLPFNRYENYDYTKSFLKNNKDDDKTLFYYSYHDGLKPIYQNNNLQIIDNNALLYQEMIMMIRSAKKFIHLQTYIIRDGFFLRTIFCELAKKAQQGVKVRFLVDWYGKVFLIKRKQFNELKKYGVEVAIFNHPGLNIFKSVTNYRMHRKALIIDNKCAIYGSSNIGDEYLSMDPQRHFWRDQNFILKGEIVNSLNIIFINDWLFFTGDTITVVQQNDLIDNIDKYLKIHKDKTEPCEMQTLINEPRYENKGILNIMASMILRAKKSIKLVTPYFAPTELCEGALCISARSGIDVKIIVPGKSDNKNITLVTNRSYYEKLLSQNCKVYEYDGFIHSKYLIIDDKIVLVTTSNFDFRSFWSGFESAILIKSEKVVSELNRTFQDDISNSKKLNLSQARKYVNRLTKFQSYLLNLYKPLI